MSNLCIWNCYQMIVKKDNKTQVIVIRNETEGIEWDTHSP